jgi:hypothetical protein
MSRIIQNDDQSISDIALQGVGDIDAVIDICVNNDLSVTDETRKEISAVDVNNKKVVELLNINTPATAAGQIPEGISVWRIGLDFKIS